MYLILHRHKEDTDFKNFAGMLDSLASLPLDVPQGMQHVKDQCPLEGTALIDYFDKTFITDEFRQIQTLVAAPEQRSQPMFQRGYYLATTADLEQTSRNLAE